MLRTPEATCESRLEVHPSNYHREVVLAQLFTLSESGCCLVPRSGWRGVSVRKPPHHMQTQRCLHLIHPLLHRLPTPDRLLVDDVPNPRLDIEQNPLQNLLHDRSKPPGSRATLKGNPSDLLYRRIVEHQIRTVKPDQLRSEE